MSEESHGDELMVELTRLRNKARELARKLVEIARKLETLE